MDTIQLSQLCPLVFKDRPDLNSQIWHQEICLEKGKIYLIEAESGTGKSSLCSYLCGYRNDYSGRIFFDKKDTHHFSMTDWTNLRCQHISHLIQDLRLFPELTALENIEMKNRLTHYKSLKQIVDWLEFLGIAHLKDVLVGKMSFGQQQRVALLRALAQPFDFLVADEPISHLDEKNAEIMGQLLLSEAQQRHAGIIMTSIGKHISIPYDTIYHL